jgi:enoyl-CoA hydratase
MWLYHCGPQWTKRLLLTGDSVSGEDAARIGFAMKSVPPEYLDSEVQGLADRFALVDSDLLSANKRVVNLGMELMGAQTLQRLAAENDAKAHTTRAARQVYKDLANNGVKQTISARDAPFGDGRARVIGPERRDADGRLLPPLD